MGNSYLFPLLRTPNLVEAYDLAQRLLALAQLRIEVEVCATQASESLRDIWLRAPVEQVDFRLTARIPARLVDAALPRLAPFVDDMSRRTLHNKDGSIEVTSFETAALGMLAGYPEIGVEIEVRQEKADEISQPFVVAVGHDIAWIYWRVMWPEAELDDIELFSSYKYDGVEITVHSAELFDDKWTTEHTVWVHVRQDERAQWLAEATGARVLAERTLGR